VRAGAQMLTTSPLALKVVSGAAPPSRPGLPPLPPTPAPEPVGEANEDIFVKTEVSNPTPYEGEQVVLTMSFYKRADLTLAETPSYSPPDTPGLVSEGLPDPPQQRVMLGNLPYTVIQRQLALFAPTPGQYQIGPAVITFTRDFFGPEETISSDPITLRVKALPASRPDDFCGLVGEMTAELNVDATQTRTGDSVTARVTINGIGDVRRIQPPKLPVSAPCRIFEAGSQAKTAPRVVGQQQLLGGTVTFEYLLVPQQAGRLTIGPVKMHYFDPATRSYRPVSTGALVLEVAQGEVSPAPVDAQPAKELAYVRNTSRALRARPPVTSSRWFWIVQLLPLIGLAVVVRQRAEIVRRERDPRYRRLVEARGRAHALLAAARRKAGEGKDAFELADEALSGYVADKLDLSAMTLSPPGARDALTEAGVSLHVAQRVEDMLRTLRAGRFAPGAALLDPRQVVRSVAQLIDELERTLGRGRGPQ